MIRHVFTIIALSFLGAEFMHAPVLHTRPATRLTSYRTSQRKIRKARRRRASAGDRFAFSH